MELEPELRRWTRAMRPAEEGPYACPCCGHLTLSQRCGWEICPICFWEDDGQDDHDADEMLPLSPNGGLSLTKARENYRAFGACEQRFVNNVRPPRNDEAPPVT